MNSIIETQDGSHTVYSEKFGVTYHSKYGAIQETQHVFIEAGLYYKTLKNKAISILEIGFGTGLNAFMTMLEAEKRGLTIEYQAAEAYPLSIAEAHQLNYPELLDRSDKAEGFKFLHESNWEEWHEISPSFKFKKLKSRFEDLQFLPIFDLIYFDAFAPSAQAELWEPPTLSIMYNALKEDGIWVSYCAKGSVKRNLKSLGFMVESIPGPPGKREMTRASR
jgi:tRNA U34 5-methylaminomethyl-2-thiouridine-forming methyltransferase MnmC